MLKITDYQVCSNCVMDSSDPKIVFDYKGICDHCNTYYSYIKPYWHTDERGNSEMNSIINRIKVSGKGKDYDCIIGMSGGVDSSYLVYAAKEIMGLRPLVFHVDAGWNSQVAVNNIERLVDGLSLDLFTEVINWEEMKDIQRAFFRSGVPHIDTPQDHAFFAVMYKFASQNNISYILTGANYSTECIRNPIDWMYYQSDSRQIRDIHKIFGDRPLRTFPMTSILWHKVWLPYVRGIKVLKPLNYIPYIKAEAQQFLTDKFGWQAYPQKHFESRFTRFYESYWLYERYGYDVRKVQFSSLILTNQMTRERALVELQKLPYDQKSITQEIEFVSNKLDLSAEELMSFMSLPKKTFRDYRNQEKIYRFGARLMRILGIERGGKR